MAPSFQTSGQGTLVTFENAAEAQTARAIFLLSGIPSDNVFSQPPVEGQPSTALTAANAEEEKGKLTIFLPGKPQAEMEGTYKAGIEAIATLKGRAASINVALQDPEIRYSNGAGQFRASIPYTDPSPDDKNAIRLTSYIALMSERVQKGDRKLIDIPLLKMDKVKALGNRLKNEIPAEVNIPSAPAPVPVTGTSTGDAPAPVKPALRINREEKSPSAHVTPPADSNAAAAVEKKAGRKWWGGKA